MGAALLMATETLREHDVTVLEALDAVVDANPDRQDWGAWTALGAYGENAEVYAAAKAAGIPWTGQQMHGALRRLAGIGLCQPAHGSVPGRSEPCPLGNVWQVTAAGDRFLELVAEGAMNAEALEAALVVV
jgi:hypothetical protein